MKRIAMIAYSYFPDDPRIRREAEALRDAGMLIDVICLRNAGEPARELWRGIDIRRIPIRRRRLGKLTYVFQYFAFILYASLRVIALQVRRRYDIIHVHNMPDILVVTALFPRLCGARVVLDLHDPMPEVFMAKFGMTEHALIIHALIVLEKISTRLAHLVLTPNIAFRNCFIRRGVPRRKLHIIMNSPQEEVFRPNGATPRNGRNGHVRLIYHGTIMECNGLGLAIEAFGRLRTDPRRVSFDIYGDGDYLPEVRRRIDALNRDEIHYHGFKKIEEIPRLIADGDIGLIPNRRTPFTSINMPTRIFEYLCKHKAVLVPRHAGILDYFDEETIDLFEPDSAEDLAAGLERLVERENRAKIDKGYDVYLLYRWEKEKRRLVELIERL